MDDDYSGFDEIGDGWTGVAGVWRWRHLAGFKGDGDDGFSWWGVAEDGAGASVFASRPPAKSAGRLVANRRVKPASHHLVKLGERPRAKLP